MTLEELYEQHQRNVDELGPLLQAQMVAVIRAGLVQGEIPVLKDEIKKNPYSWWAKYHHGFGQNVRNLLRMAGLGERNYPRLRNLDDYWVPLVELAVNERPATSYPDAPRWQTDPGQTE